MRKKIFLLFAYAIFLSACKKESQSPANPGAGGGTTALKVNSFNPEQPYLDDEMTITGTGFNPNKSLDTVLLNYKLATIVSASATELKIKFPEEGSMGMSVCNCSSFEVRANGKVFKVTKGITFKRDCKLFGINNPDNFNYQIGRPSDSLVISGSGFNKPGSVIRIDGKQLDNYKVDSGYNCMATLRLPKTFFGGENDENIMLTKKVSITNSDGKTSEKDLNFWISPRMHINGMAAEKPTYSKADLASTGGLIKITIAGTNLKNDAVVKIDGSTGIHTINLLAVNGFPDNTILEISAASLLAGNYQVSVWRETTLYGVCNFVLNP